MTCLLRVISTRTTTAAAASTIVFNTRQITIAAASASNWKAHSYVLLPRSSLVSSHIDVSLFKNTRKCNDSIGLVRYLSDQTIKPTRRSNNHVNVETDKTIKSDKTSTTTTSGYDQNKTRPDKSDNSSNDKEERRKTNKRTNRLVAFGCVGLAAWLVGQYLKQTDANTSIRLYKKLPLRSMSRAWGEINSIELPTWCRKPCFYFYSWMFSCNLDEIDIDDITHYKNLGEFFRRGLKPDARKIHPSTLVSPCDGKILHFGRVEKGMLEQVKGVNYSLQAFLGQRNWPKNAQSASKPKFSSLSFSSGSSSSSSSLSDDDSRSLNDSGMLDPNMSAEEIAAAGELLEKSILYNPDENCLYHCVIYLAPGDYHRFHSPTDWTVFARRHFPGELFSVNPSVARWLQGLFNFNERVVYYGEWEHGFFSMTAVGATNVGSIRVYMDDGLATNTKQKDLKPEDLEKSFVKYDAMTSSFEGVELKKGDNFGEFNLGSTIVLIFEAPKDFRFSINQNEKVFYGCQLGAAPSSIEQTKL